MKEPVKYTRAEANALLKQGKKVCLGENENDYWVVRGPNDDPCLTEPTLFHHEPNGGLRRECLKPPQVNHLSMDTEKYCEKLTERAAFNQHLKENPPKPVDE